MSADDDWMRIVAFFYEYGDSWKFWLGAVFLGVIVIITRAKSVRLMFEYKSRE